MSNELGRVVQNVSHKLDKVYEAVAETVRKERGSFYTEEFGDFLFELCNRLEKADPAFNRIEFMNMADPD